jgi:polyisoprenoid-binding protein YceI
MSSKVIDAIVRHLASDDFFDVAKYPTAKFQLTAAKPLPPGTPGSPNYEISGRLTLKGITGWIAFSAIVGQTGPETMVAQGHLEFDRTRCGVQYGSGKFFALLGKHLVH